MKSSVSFFIVTFRSYHDRLFGSSVIEKYDDHAASDYLNKHTNTAGDMQPFLGKATNLKPVTLSDCELRR